MLRSALGNAHFAWLYLFDRMAKVIRFEAYDSDLNV